jgi:hypothetical protein
MLNTFGIRSYSVTFHFTLQWLISGMQNALPNVVDWCAEYVRRVVVQGAILRCTTLQRLIGPYGSDLTCETYLLTYILAEHIWLILLNTFDVIIQTCSISELEYYPFDRFLICMCVTWYLRILIMLWVSLYVSWRIYKPLTQTQVPGFS